ncbi:hypothetical protein [Sphingomonas sp.]|uniref:lysozyme inhibitor LprI family protein n=1 Tax=Sphingomonas sp. TaxID=28214 RepID=UPI00286E7C7E|nr:hypothetical protein [Sphingomonas sp.]
MTDPRDPTRVGTPVPTRRLSPALIALLAIGALILLLIGVAAWRGSGNPDALDGNQTAAERAAADPEKRCASQRTYDLIKRELFRRAAALRGSDQAAFDKLAAYAVVRMDAPMLRSEDEDLNAVSCTGTLTLDLPPGVAVVGGRRSLDADLNYALQPAADGTGEVLTLSNADAIVTPLATLSRIGRPAGEPLTPPARPPSAPVAPLPADPLAPAADPRPEPAPPPAVEPPAAAASPSFNCRNARTRGEIMVCRDGGLAALDRQMATQFNRAIGSVGPGERAMLERSRGRFLSYRDSCRSESCIADAYRGRMREIADIVAGRWEQPR